MDKFLCCSSFFRGESAERRQKGKKGGVSVALLSGRSALSPWKELEQHSNLFQYGGVQRKSIWEACHLNIQCEDERR